MLCLRGILITNEKSFLGYEDNIPKRFAEIVRDRRHLYLVSLYGTMGVTFAFMLTIIGHVFGPILLAHLLK